MSSSASMWRDWQSPLSLRHPDQMEAMTLCTQICLIGNLACSSR